MLGASRGCAYNGRDSRPAGYSKEAEMRLAIVLAVLTALAACTSAPAGTPPRPAESGAAPAGAAEAERTVSAPPRLEKVRAAYAAPSGSFAAPWVAKEAGLFEKYGLDAELTYIASGPTMNQAMIAGELQFGELAAPSSMNAFLEGGEIVWITGAVSRPVLMMVAPPEIQRIEDLRGRPVGVTRLGTTTHTFMKLALRGAGLDPERDVQILQSGGVPETVAGLQTGRIYAGVTGPPSVFLTLQAGMHVLVSFADMGIPWPFGGTITTKSYIAAQPERVRAYVKAYTEAIHLLRTDREQSVRAMAKYGDLADPAIAEQTWESFRPYFNLPPRPEAAAMELVVQEELAAINPKALGVPPEAYYDDRFVRELADSGFVRQLEGR
jgi:NitT/TauT family transport system substrate-binding protein